MHMRMAHSLVLHFMPCAFLPLPAASSLPCNSSLPCASACSVIALGSNCCISFAFAFHQPMANSSAFDPNSTVDPDTITLPELFDDFVFSYVNSPPRLPSDFATTSRGLLSIPRPQPPRYLEHHVIIRLRTYPGVHPLTAGVVGELPLNTSQTHTRD